MKKSLMQSKFIDSNDSNNQVSSTLTNDNLPMLGTEKIKNLILKEQMVFPDNENNDLNLNSNLKLVDNLYKLQNEDYNSNLCKFNSFFYNKFKKVFLMNIQTKNTNFLPVSEINERQKLIN